ncbi:Uu.00g133550.m01.CDS01 [Anthostomella pinea]|uniref:Uu.00g133550.m01.CDS01 n=1 Tax=Anthostomella pinea TaxID=933095 RepID=A0AAI8VNU5_9PEZI|nr:Uu.00g133550.m01.CDS01 [Anthostomella pinea]
MRLYSTLPMSFAALLATSPVTAHPQPDHPSAVQLSIRTSAAGASIAHSPSFSSFSFEPAFWVDFFGNASSPNALTFRLLDLIHQHGGAPIIRPGGITMDSMIFNASASPGDSVRDVSTTGGVYRTTVGPAYYESWSNFPNGTKFVSTLNFGNDSLDIALGLAVASVIYQRELVEYFELGNEPTNYPSSRWNDSTAAYVAQWKNWTAAIDAAVNSTVGASSDAAQLGYGSERWWASSATTDITGLKVKPADIIPFGIDSMDQVAEYSIHSYPFSTCDPARAALATIANILNHTYLASYADTSILPSALAALDAGSSWTIGEFNSISCSGAPNVSDTFAQALWVIDSELIYAVRNASSCHLHQGATLAFQSGDQVNTPGANGTPGFSTYDMVYPETSELRGAARVLPSFAGLLFLAEVFATDGTRIVEVGAPEGVDADYFAAYALYEGGGDGVLSKLAVVNLRPYYANLTTDYTVSIDISAHIMGGALNPKHHGPQPHYGGDATATQAYVKRLTAPYVDAKDAADVTWAGQSFANGSAIGQVRKEVVGDDGIVSVRGSEAVLVFL